MESLKILELTSCNFLAEHAESIASMLSRNKTLQSLDLSVNDFGEQISVIFDSLKQNKFLKSFSSAYATSIKGGVRPVLEVIQQSSTLTKLDISENEMSKEDCKEIFKILKFNNSLSHLAFGSSSQNEQLLEPLIEFIECNRHMNSLLAFNIRVEEGNEAKQVLRAIKENCSLTSLHLQFGRRVEEVRMEIDQQLEKNKEIERKDEKVKELLLILQKRRDGNLVGKLPRRVLLYLLSFLRSTRIPK